MKMLEVARPSSIQKPPARMTAVELRLLLHSREEEITLVDVRDPAAFLARHLPGSINAPDSQTTALVKKMQTFARAVLICDNGRTSALVTRTLGFCGFRAVAYLEGGIEAWTASGGALAETTRSGFEKLLAGKPEPPSKPGFFARYFASIL
jgi:thiosulfate sulfurtransferase